VIDRSIASKILVIGIMGIKMSNLLSTNTDTAIIVITVSDWDEPPRMRHYVAKQLSRFCTVIYIQIYTSGRQSICYKENERLFVIKLGGYVRGVYRVRAVRLAFDLIQALRIRRIIRKLSFKKYIAINFQYDFFLISHLRRLFACVFGFINDDFVNLPPGETNRTKATKLHDLTKMLAACDHVFVSANYLGRYADLVRRSFTTIISGHDFPVDFVDVEPSTDHSRMIDVCFMGYVDNNLRYDWISRALDDKAIRINFVGPVRKGDPLLQFIGRSNFKLRKAMVGRELYDFLMANDVLIMPYSQVINNEITVAPAKLFQYLATGRPIVSSVLPNLINLPQGFLTQANTEAEFVRSLHTAAHGDSLDLRRSRRAFAASHTWDKRGDELWNLISNHT
jgi:hypothetical protein